jgi:hypothetical protein
MASSMDEFFIALDNYMKSNSKGGSSQGKYLASKMSFLFDDPRSPFSTNKNGVLYKLGEKINKLTTKIEHITDNTLVFDTLNDSVLGLNIELHKMRSISKNINDSLTKMMKNLAQGVNPNINVPTTAINPTNMSAFIDAFAHRFSTRDVHSNFRRDSAGNAHYDVSKSLDVQIIHIRDDVLSSLSGAITKHLRTEKVLDDSDKKPGWFAAFFNTFDRKNNQAGYRKPYERKYSSTESPGILSSIFGWITKISLWIGGIMLIGKTGDWLQHSNIGKMISRMASNIFGKMTDWISTYIKSGKFIDQVEHGIETISTFVTSIFKNLISFGNRNKSVIKENGGRLFDSIWNNILNPIIHGINNFLGNIDYTGIFNSLFDNIVKPFFSSLGDDLEKGEYGRMLIKGGLALLITSKFIPGLSILTGALAAIPFNPTILALAALGGSLYYVKDAIDNFTKKAKDFSESTAERHNMLQKQIELHKSTLMKEIESHNSIQSDSSLSLERKQTESVISGLQQKLIILAKKMETERSEITGKQENEGSIAKMFNASYWAKKEKAVVTKYTSEMDKLTQELKIAVKKADQIRAKDSETSKSLDSDVMKIVKQIRPDTKKVQDAIVVEPHSKDQVLMAKTGGPVDLALKSMISKMDEEIELLRNGFTMLVNATTAGSSAVVQTVAATAGSKETNHISGGRSPVTDYRQHVDSRIRR